MININEKINSVEYDHYPLNQMMPAYSVFNIFFDNYKKEQNKSAFLNNHKYLKLREGYYSFVCSIAFDKIEGREHFLFFPKDDNMGDVGFIAEKNKGVSENMEMIMFDIKEYHTIDSKNFDEYLDHIFSKDKIKKNIYGLIIGLNRDVFLNDDTVKKIKEKSKTLSRGIFLCSANQQDQDNEKKSSCAYFLNGEIVFHEEEIILSNNGNNDILIYQDIIKILGL